MNKIYFGRYIPRDSIIHKINPLIKIIAAAVTTSTLIVFGINIEVFIFITLIFAMLIFASKLHIIEILKGLKSFRFLFLFIFFTRLFFNTDGSISFNLNFHSLFTALLTLYQFMLIVAFSLILTFTTTPSDITKALFFFTKPLKLFKVNRENIAVSILTAVRFIPLIFEEADKIITAQKIRGLWIHGKSFKDKIVFIFNLDSLIIPLLMRVFFYAEQISITLSYRQNIESVLKLDKLTNRDIIFITLIILANGVPYAVF